jgi:hypothetical protein
VGCRRGTKRLVAVIFTVSILASGCSAATAPAKAIEDPRTVAISSVQNFLAGEHAAIWAYGRAAALLPKGEITAALREIAKHERERDQLALELRAAGVEPVGALVAYDVYGPLANARDARMFLAQVEARLAALALAVKGIPSKPEN